MKIILASSSQVGNPFAHYLQERCNLESIITAPDKVSGRGRKILPNAFSAYCETLQLAQFKPENRVELKASLKELKPDLVVTVAYGRLIRKTELDIPKFGWLNVHFSLLPRWRGASPVQQTILHGDVVSGVTVFKLDEGMDTGPVYISKEIRLTGMETSESLLNRLSEVGVQALGDALEKLKQGESPKAQSSDGITLAPKISKEDGRIDWGQSAQAIERKVRAMHPWPGAWGYVRKNRIIINSGVVSNDTSFREMERGVILVGKSVSVQCGNSRLILQEVTPEGKRRMSAAEWIRGFQNQNDLRFDSNES